MMLNLKLSIQIILFLIFSIQVCASSNSMIKPNLNCDLRPFNELHLLNYFLKQQLKQDPIQSDSNLKKKFHEFRSTIDLSELENDCDKKPRAKFALIKHGKRYEYENESASNKKTQKNRKKISERMSLELVNALLLGKLLGLNLGMLSSVIFANVFRPGGSTTPAPGGGAGGGSAGGGGDQAGGGGGGDQGGAAGGGNDGAGGGGGNGRFLNYELDNISSRFNEQEDEYCDENESMNNNNSPVENKDYSDWKYKRNYNSKRRSKRDLLRQLDEDNEDLWSNSETPIYIPTLNHYTPDLTSTAVHNHNTDLVSSKSKFKNTNLSPSFSYLTPSSSFAFPQQIPIYYKPKVRKTPPLIKTLFDQKTKLNNKIPNLFPSNYDDTNLAAADNFDYQDEMGNKREDIDLEHKLKEPAHYYFDDEFEDELFNKNYEDKKFNLDKELNKNFNENFDRNFDKKFKSKKGSNNNKKSLKPRNEKTKNRRRRTNRPSIKQVDTSQIEREDDLDSSKERREKLDKKSKDTKEQKLVRITRQITVYNKNLFEDRFNLRSIDKEELLGDSSLEKSAKLIDDEDEEQEEENDELKKVLKSKKRVRKRRKEKRRSPANRTTNRKKKTYKKRVLKSNGTKQKRNKRRNVKSRSSNLISKNNSIQHL